MSSFLMWEYQGVDVGRFHTATTAAKKASMISKGFMDITGLQGWVVPYPTGKGKKIKTPKPAVDLNPPVDATPAPVDPII